MFGWFQPTCPVDAVTKRWIEDRLNWLAREFPQNVFTSKPLILPTADFFPDVFDGSYQSLRTMLDRVCNYMGVEPNRVELRTYQANRNLWLVNGAGRPLPGAPAGTYEQFGHRFIIQLDEAEIDDTVGLVGTFAHELAHARLLGERRLFGSEFDNELLTDLTVVVHGLGIFLANSPRHWDSQYSKWPGSELLKPEYMTSPMFGYSIAHLAWCRGEQSPAWAKHLHPSARSNLRQGLNYLWKTRESTFIPLRLNVVEAD